MSKSDLLPGKGFKRSFSRRFDNAITETRLIDALVKADGWTLAEYAGAPTWLQQFYIRHAEAARREMLKIRQAEGA